MFVITRHVSAKGSDLTWSQQLWRYINIAEHCVVYIVVYYCIFCEVARRKLLFNKLNAINMHYMAFFESRVPPISWLIIIFPTIFVINHTFGVWCPIFPRTPFSYHETWMRMGVFLYENCHVHLGPHSPPPEVWPLVPLNLPRAGGGRWSCCGSFILGDMWPGLWWLNQSQMVTSPSNMVT